MENDTLKSAIEGGYALWEKIDLSLENGQITEEEWFTLHEKELSSKYLASDNVRGQSGHGGDEQRYRYTQEMILAAIDRSGTFIDVGCANGYLMESLSRWLEGGMYNLQFYGLDMSAGLIELARNRLPNWKNRFFVGNALFWTPGEKYDLVCIKELNYVPRGRRRQLFNHLAETYVRKGGRLILGPYTEFKTDPGVAALTSSWGYPPTGSISKPHQEHEGLERRLRWYDF